MLFNMVGFTIDIVVVLASGIIGIFTPKKLKPQLKAVINHLLAIKDTPEPNNKCYAVQVFSFPTDKHTSKTAHTPKNGIEDATTESASQIL